MTAPFALYLRDLRYRKALIQAELARAIGYEQAYLSSLELGLKPPTDELLERLAKSLGLNELEREEMRAEAAASKSRFVLQPDAPSETFRFCNDLWNQIDSLHPAIVFALHTMIMVDRQVMPPYRQTPERLRRRQTKEAQMQKVTNPKGHMPLM